MKLLITKSHSQTFKINAQVKQTWLDSRVRFPPNETSDTLILWSDWRDKLWQPATYFYNAVEGTNLNVLSPPLFFELSKDNRVTMSTRMIIKLTCDMNLHFFPHDKQNCHVHLESCELFSCISSLS